jgi:hypothetical protein
VPGTRVTEPAGGGDVDKLSVLGAVLVVVLWLRDLRRPAPAEPALDTAGAEHP